MKTRNPRPRQGFTLVEMMVALTVGALVMILILSSFSSLSTALASSRHYRNMHQDVRYSMNVMQKDITGASGVLEYIASNRLVLSTGTNAVSVAYNLSSNVLSRTVSSGSAKALAAGVDGILFTLYEASGAATADPASAYFVRVEMSMKTSGVRDTYLDTLQIRSRMRGKGL